MTFSFKPCPLPPLSRVWIYLRDSGGDTQDLASQDAYALEYCKHYQLNPVRVFRDAAVSGGSIVGRDDFELMIDTARYSDGPVVDAILYWDMKRFARNELDNEYFMADLRRRGYLLVSLSDDIPQGKFTSLFEAFLRIKAEQDLEDISKDTKRGLAFVVGLKDTDGRYVGLFPGRPPTFFTVEPYNITEALGIRRNDGSERVVQRLVPDPQTWELGRVAWQMRAERASYREIEAEIKMFSHAQQPSGNYTAIFRNEIYTGRLRYGGRVYENFVPSLATPEQWQAVQAQRRKIGQRNAKRGPSSHPKAGRGSYLLSGLCECGYCQSAMHGERNTRSDRQKYWRYYVCNQKKARRDSCPSKQTSAERLEESVISTVCGTILTVDFVAQFIEMANASLSNTERLEREMERAQAELLRLDKAIKNLIYMAEMSPSPSLARQLNEREMERARAQQEVEALRAQSQVWRLEFDPSLVNEALTGYRTGLRSGATSARRKLLRELLEKVAVGKDSARLHLKVDMTRLLAMPPTGMDLKTCHKWEVVSNY